MKALTITVVQAIYELYAQRAKSAHRSISELIREAMASHAKTWASQDATTMLDLVGFADNKVLNENLSTTEIADSMYSDRGI